MMNEYINKLESIEDRENYKPLFRRVSTWIYIGIGIILLSLVFGLTKCTQAVAYSFKTEEGEFVCYDQYIKEVTVIERWGTKREYNRSSVPKEAWDVDKNTYCASRDTNDVCTRYEDEYDYSIRGWKSYDKITKNHTQYSDNHLLKYSGSEFKVQTHLTYYGKFYNHNSEEQWITGTEQFKPQSTYRLLYYVKSKQIKQ